MMNLSSEAFSKGNHYLPRRLLARSVNRNAFRWSSFSKNTNPFENQLRNVSTDHATSANVTTATTETSNSELSERVNNDSVKLKSIQQISTGTSSYTYPIPVIIDKKGVDIMNTPLLNKGVAFTYSERDRLQIRGLMPPTYSSLEEQAHRTKSRLDEVSTDIGKYLMLNSLQDRNETLFYKLLIDYIEELAPIVYTPTVGKVCQGFGFLYRRPRGMYFSSRDRGEIHSMVYNWPSDDVHVAVITDGSRVLGLGDLGANGMAIPIGKMSLYVAAAGIHPHRGLPVMIDAGTNNEELLNDPFYYGLRHRRLTGEAFVSLVDEVIYALQNRWPKILIQFEDFSNINAYPLLHKYRHLVRCFNDDIQGTGAVALAGIYSALRVQGKNSSSIRDQRVVCVGAGSAGLGVLFSLLNGMKNHGLSQEEAAKNFWVLDNLGLLAQTRTNLTEGQKVFARHDEINGLSLLEVIRKVKPTILLGLSGVGGVFTEEVLLEMAKYSDRPIIFPLSNPTDRAECSASMAFSCTGGRAIFASGSPFQPVSINGKTCYASQGNNMFIFPGVGLGAIVCGAKRISTSMFTKAAEILSSCVTMEQLEKGKVYPEISKIRSVSLKVAVEVVKVAFSQKLAKNQMPEEFHSLEEWISSYMYIPEYVPYIQNDQINKY